jgi:hypothetical protein
MSAVASFLEICDLVASGAPFSDEVNARVRSIDFDSFDIDEIKLVRDAAWLPDDLAADILKGWVRHQDQILLKLRAHLVVTPAVDKPTLREFTRAIRKPSEEPPVIVEDVIHKLATAGGTRAAVNAKDANLIIATASSEIAGHPLSHLFSPSPNEFFMSNCTQAQSIVVSLPPFLKLQLRSYKLGAPPKEEGKSVVGGISSWHIDGSNDPNNFQDLLDAQSANRDLVAAGAVHRFAVTDSHKTFYQHFRLTNDGQSHQNNLSILLSEFDLSGVLIICRGNEP